VKSHLLENRLQDALQSIWQIVTLANQFVDQTAPFKLAKDPSQAERLDGVLYNLCEVCRILAVLLSPFLPGTSARIYEQLGLGVLPEHFSTSAWGELKAGHTIGEPAALFPRRDEKAKK
jgi:methionyl-tRNA synthetase